MQKKIARNYGIDLLRIMSMFGVVFLHILGHGGVIHSAQSVGAFSVAWLLEILAYPAVNCFVLISGFVGYREEKYFPKLRNIISLCFTVLFYSVSISILFKCIYPSEIGIATLVKSLLPISTSQYWFFSCYFGLFLLSPVLNLFVAAANKKTLTITALVILVVVPILTFIGDPFVLISGYSVLWFVFLYLLGAIIKKCQIPRKIPTAKCIIVVGCVFAIMWITKILGFTAHNMVGTLFSKLSDRLISYCSPAVLLVSIGLLCVFAKTTVTRSLHKPLKVLSLTAFSVYLIHDNLLVRSYVITDRFSFISQFNPLVMLLLIVCCALGIFVLCSMIDTIRIFLFKVLHIEQLSVKIECLTKKLINRFFAKEECSSQTVN